MTAKQYGANLRHEAARDARSAFAAPPGLRGTSGTIREHTPEELGRAARAALNRFSVGTRLTGVARDRAGIALVRNKLPRTRDLFTDAQLAAALREIDPASRSCLWDNLRALTAAAGEPMPTEPTAPLLALLGQPCSRCRISFEAGEIAERERRLIASGIRRRPTQPAPAPAPARSSLTSSARATAQRGRATTADRDVCPCRQCERKRGR